MSVQMQKKKHKKCLCWLRERLCYILALAGLTPLGRDLGCIRPFFLLCPLKDWGVWAVSTWSVTIRIISNDRKRSWCHSPACRARRAFSDTGANCKYCSDRSRQRNLVSNVKTFQEPFNRQLMISMNMRNVAFSHAGIL